MSPDTFIEGIRDLLHQRAVLGGEPVASSLGNLLRQVAEVFECAVLPNEDSDPEGDE